MSVRLETHAAPPAVCALLAALVAAGCTREVDVKYPIPVHEADQAASRFAAGETKIPVKDERGHVHDAGSSQLSYLWEDGRSFGVMVCHGNDRIPGYRAPDDCVRPPPPVRAELTTTATAPNWPGILLGSLAVAAIGGSIGCFATWCDSTGRTAVGVADGVVAGALVVGGFILFVDLMKRATRD